MKKKIIYLTEDGVIAIKNNKDKIFKEIVSNKTTTLQELLQDEGIVKQTGMEIEELVLDMSQPEGYEHLTDAENVARVYNRMKGLSDSQASDERIWMAYTFIEQLDYMRYRWKTPDKDKMMNRYAFNYSAMRSLFRNGMARLWWMGRITYDPSRQDPYELTKFICKYLDIVDDFWSRTLFNNPITAKAVLNAMYDAHLAGVEIVRPLVRDISKYCNLLAGTYMLEILGYDFIYQKIYERVMRGKEVK